MPNNRPCPVCKTPSENASLFLERNIDEKLISSFSYASRKEPELMCHKLVHCNNCDLIYACNPPEQKELADAYHTSEYDSAEEANDAAYSYIRAIKPVLKNMNSKIRVLEIGSGTGIFLELLQKEGFSELVGVEPSSAAIAAAPLERRKWLREEIFVEGNFEPRSFDLICCFMTLEHVQDPLLTAESAYNLLRPGGAFVTVTHDHRSLVNRILGKKSPIIDIEHMQIFSKYSIQELFKRSNYTDFYSVPFLNKYSISYWMRLAPLPKFIKEKLIIFLKITGLNSFKIALNVGNSISAGFRK